MTDMPRGLRALVAIIAITAIALAVGGCADDSRPPTAAGIPEPTSTARSEDDAASSSLDALSALDALSSLDALSALDDAALDALLAGAAGTGTRARSSAGGTDRVRHCRTHGRFGPGAGGILDLCESLWLDIPDDAMPRRAVIEARTLVVLDKEGRAQLVHFDFDPALKFEQPIWLVAGWDLVSGLADDEGNIQLLYFDRGRERWEGSAVGKRRGDEVWFAIDHFSKYALSRIGGGF